MESVSNNKNYNESQEDSELNVDLENLNNQDAFEGKNEKARSRFKKIMGDIKDGWSDMASFPKAMFVSIFAILTVPPSVEITKRLLAEGEYEKTKKMLNEYVISYTSEKFDEDAYQEALELFGEDNLYWIDKEGDLQDFNEDTARINEHLRRRHYNRGDVFDVGYNINSWDFFYKNNYTEEFKNIQQKISELDSGSVNNGESDSTIINTKTAVGFRDYNNPEKFDTLRKETLKKIIYETYPKNWFLGEVEYINFNKDRKIIKQYGNDEFESAGDFHESEMNFYGYEDIYASNPNFFIEAFSHESGHANDWERNNEMSLNQKLNLLLAVADRLDDNDRFMSSYVEETIKTKDTKDRLDNKAIEYWAEICAEYFTNGKANLSPKDVKLIEGVIKIKDPDFNIDEAINKRVLIIHRDVYKENPEQVKELTKMIELKSLLEKKITERNNFYNKNSKVIEEYMVRGMFTYDPNENARNPILDEYARLGAQIEYSIDAINEASKKYHEQNKQSSLLDAINYKYDKL